MIFQVCHIHMGIIQNLSIRCYPCNAKVIRIDFFQKIIATFFCSNCCQTQFILQLANLQVVEVAV